MTTAAADVTSTATTLPPPSPPPIYLIPQDTLQHIFTLLPLRQIIRTTSVSKYFNQTLSSPSFLSLIPPPSTLALRSSHHPTLHAFDPNLREWLKFPLNFLPFKSHQPVASSLGLVYLWADSDDSNKSLLVCNPVTRTFNILPRLGSAWSRHGSVLVSKRAVLVLTELAVLYYSGSDNWLKFSSNLPSKPRSPILVDESIVVLCDVGSPWRAQWKLFTVSLESMRCNSQWTCLEKQEWGDVFDILKRPRLVKGNGNKVLMIGGLKSSFLLNSSCSTILILRLDLDTLEWDEAGRMPVEMYRCFQESSKFKVFGGGDRVCFSAKRIGKLALWDNSGESGKAQWKWIEGVPWNGDGLCRGFLFEPEYSAAP